MAWFLALAALPLALQMRQRRNARAAWLLIGVWLMCAAGFTWYARASRPGVGASSLPPDRPLAVETTGYATSDTCRSCHPSEYHSWHRSYHRSMTQLPGLNSVLGDFDDRTVNIMNHRFELSRKGEDFFVEADLIRDWSPPGFTAPRDRRLVKLLTGSHHMQVYWTATGHSRRLEQIPIVHLVEANRWVPRDSVFLMPNRSMSTEAGRWNKTCVKCHSTHGEGRVASGFEMDTRVAEFGIACEECHGPGAQHVAINRDPKRRYQLRLAGNGDPTIVNPAKLSAKLQSHVCGQCHGVHFDRTHDSHNDYQPGDDLLAMSPIIHLDSEETIIKFRADRGDIYVNGKFWPDGMLRVSGRELNGLVKSPCFTHGDESRGIMSCLDCHSSHHHADDSRPLKIWANDQLKPNAVGNASCIKCHPKYSDPTALTSHTRHSANSSGSLCYNCHMPHTSYGLLNAIRSHTLDSPDIKVTQETGRPNACNQCHLDKTLRWTALHLTDWYDQPDVELSEEEKNVAASILQIVKGDAAQRALSAWCMGWESALNASGNNWQAPYLAQLLNDQYDAVRYIAQRSLLRLPGFGDFQYDFIGMKTHLAEASTRAHENWRSQAVKAMRNPDLLINADGSLEVQRLLELLRQRDNKPIVIAE